MTARILIPLTLFLFCRTVPALELAVSPDVSTTGTYNIRWQGPEDAHYELTEENGKGETRIIYQGTDTARVMTGMPNGRYTYRIRAEGTETPGPLSDPASVTVAHHPLTRAFGFFGIGLLVFLATVTIILRGERNG